MGYAQSLNFSYYEVSARTGYNLSEMFEEIAQHITCKIEDGILPQDTRAIQKYGIKCMDKPFPTTPDEMHNLKGVGWHNFSLN